MFNSSKKNLAKNVRKIIFLRKAFRSIERLRKLTAAREIEFTWEGGAVCTVRIHLKDILLDVLKRIPRV